ncbi:hypothetical protein WJB62_000500 [Klebsiella pneumoniae]
MNRRAFIFNSACALMLPNNGVLAQNLTKDSDYDIDFYGQRDSTKEFQRMINDAIKMALKVPNGLQKIPIYINGIIKISKPITIDASKVCLIGPATIVFSDSTNWEGENAIKLVSFGNQNAAYTNCVGSTFESMNFFSEKPINLFYAENKGESQNNPVCLLTISNCRFTCFDKVFQNGNGGWGWVWNNCGFDQCQYLLYLQNASDSYERFSFYGCVWQNGGTAFYVDNPNGKIYWDSGSFDYCVGIAFIKNGHVSVSGHLEFRNRSIPAVIITGEHSSFLFHNGSVFIAKSNNQYYLFKQIIPNQVTLRDVTIVSDSIGVNNIFISNLDYVNSGLTFGSSVTQKILQNKSK